MILIFAAPSLILLLTGLDLRATGNRPMGWTLVICGAAYILTGASLDLYLTALRAGA